MPQSSVVPQTRPSRDIDESQPSQLPRRRRGRRGGRRRKSAAVKPTGTADEQVVSQQLRLLTSARGAKSEQASASQVSPDPQLVYQPPLVIGNPGAKADSAPVSAASFNKSESPLQAVVATVGSMAILAALYHFGYWEGSQVQLESPAYASVAAPPAMSAAPLPSAVVLEAAPVEQAKEPIAPEAVEPIAPVEIATPMPAQAGPKGLYLQAAALKDVEAARSLSTRLQTAGFVTQIVDEGEDGWIRVVSGPYDEMSEAQAVAADMASVGVEPFPRRF